MAEPQVPKKDSDNPATGQNTTPAPPSDAKEVARPKPTGKAPAIVGRTPFSIKNIIDAPEPDVTTDKEEASQSEESDAGEKREKQPFTEEDLIRVWHEMADAFRQDSKDSFFATLKAHDPQLEEGCTVRFTIINSVQEKDFEEHKQQVLDYLRLHLRNYDIRINLELNKQKQADIAYTDEQKVLMMMKDHPQLKKLLDDLDLEPDF